MLPQQNTCPVPFTIATECERPAAILAIRNHSLGEDEVDEEDEAAAPPLLLLLLLLESVIGTGAGVRMVGAGFVLPPDLGGLRPHCCDRFDPQQNTRPDCVRAMACQSPAAIC